MVTQSKDLCVENFLTESKGHLLLDVRSESEYVKGHIPSAVNIALFDDEERKKVGTLYKKNSQKAAILAGLEFAGKKLRVIVEKVIKFNKGFDNPVYLYCSRGGMRSSSVAWLLSTSNFNVFRLESGYKAYRNHVLNLFKEDFKFIVLGGKTGSGKTEILKNMLELGEQIIDLEGIACHKGSAFGHLGQNIQPSNQQFENNLATELEAQDIKKDIWLEDESPGIGSVFIPYDIRAHISKAPVVNIHLPFEERKKRILREYGEFDVEMLIEKTERIQKRLGRENCILVSDLLKKGVIADAVDILLRYYDKGYEFALNKTHGSKNIFDIPLEYDRPYENAEKIISFYRNCL